MGKSVASEKTVPFRPDGSKLKAKNIMPMLREIIWAYLTSAYSRSKRKSMFLIQAVFSEKAGPSMAAANIMQT